MDAADKLIFKQAISLAQAGQTSQAHTLLVKLLKENPEESNLLLWLAFTTPELTEAQRLLNRVETLDPTNPSLAGAKQWLASRAPQPVPAPAFTAVPSASGTATTPDNSVSTNPANVPVTTAPPVEKEARPRGRFTTPLLALAGLMVLGLAVVFALVVSGVISVAPLNFQGLPVFTPSTHIELTDADQKKLESLQSLGLISRPGYIDHVSFDMYTLKRSDSENAKQFYQAEMKKLGWGAPPQAMIPQYGGNSELFGYYFKGDALATIGLLDPVSAGGSIPLANRKYVVPSDEKVLMIVVIQMKSGTPAVPGL